MLLSYSAETSSSEKCGKFLKTYQIRPIVLSVNYLLSIRHCLHQPWCALEGEISGHSQN